jgi:beta-phosphoglucomutase
VRIPEEKHDTFIDGKRSYYRQIVDVQFYGGTIDVIRTLKERGFKVAIVTACAQKTMCKSLTENYRLLFDLIQTGDDVPQAKPNPDPYDMARSWA